MASVYYTALLKNRYPTPPEVVFRNVHCYKENYNVDYLDYALFRFNIIVQTNKSNTIEDGLAGFSLSCSGNMQIYPTTFTSTPQFLTLNNRIDDIDTFTIDVPDRFPYGRMIYCTDTILDNAVANIEDKLTVECLKHCGNAVLKFNFSPFDDTDPNNQESLIYSINVELLNAGKIPMHLISSKNFHIDIN
jgi:hypothetical protein